MIVGSQWAAPKKAGLFSEEVCDTITGSITQNKTSFQAFYVDKFEYGEVIYFGRKFKVLAVKEFSARFYTEKGSMYYIPQSQLDSIIDDSRLVIREERIGLWGVSLKVFRFLESIESNEIGVLNEDEILLMRDTSEPRVLRKEAYNKYRRAITEQMQRKREIIFKYACDFMETEKFRSDVRAFFESDKKISTDMIDIDKNGKLAAILFKKHQEELAKKEREQKISFCVIL